MLNNITVDNFKSLKHIEFQCAGLNLLTGLNGAGKSSFVQLLRLMQATAKAGFGVQVDLSAEKSGCGKGFKDLQYCYATRLNKVGFKVKFGTEDDNHMLDRVIRGDETGWSRGVISVERPELDEKFQDYFAKYFSLQARSVELDSNVTGEDLDAAEEVARDGLARVKTQWKDTEATAVQQFCEMWKGSRFVDAFRSKPKELSEGGKYGSLTLTLGDPNWIDSFDPEGDDVMEYLYKFGNCGQESGKRVPLIEKVNECLQWVSPGAKLCIDEKDVAGTDYYVAALDYGVHGDHRKFKPQHVGFGVSYILPVLTTLLSARSGNIIIIENPEAHLHPRGQSEIGKLIAQTVARGVQVFVETHSDHVINGIRVAVKKGVLRPSDVNIAFFERKTVTSQDVDGKPMDEIYSEMRSIKVDENGSLSEYPTDFMDEWNNQLMKLI